MFLHKLIYKIEILKIYLIKLKTKDNKCKVKMNNLLIIKFNLNKICKMLNFNSENKFKKFINKIQKI